MKKREDSKKNFSMKRRYLSIVFIFAFIAIICSVGYYVFATYTENKLYEKQREIELRYSEAGEIRDILTGLIIEGRGYFIFQKEAELSRVYDYLDLLDEKLEGFKPKLGSKAEEAIFKELEEYYYNYRYESLPRIIDYVNSDKSESFVTTDEGLSSTEDTLELIRNEHLKYHTELTEISNKLLENLRQYTTVSSLMYSGFIIGLITLIVVLISRITRPIEDLEHATNLLSEGESIRLPERKKNDEFSRLMHSFIHMAKQIQGKEEELVAQNEELWEQQEKLKEQQDLIGDSLKETERVNHRLERLNELNHRLTFTLDKQRLIDSFHGFLSEMYPTDRSMLWLVNEKVYRAENLKEETIQRLLYPADALEAQYEVLKVDMTYLIKRQIEQTDLGIAEEDYFAYDLYSAIFNEEEEIIAVYTATRVGYPFTEQEVEDLNGLMKRIGLSIERIKMYEEVEMAHLLSQDIIENVNEGIQYIDDDGKMLQFNHILRDTILSTDWKYRSELAFKDWSAAFDRICKEPEYIFDFFRKVIDKQQKEVLAMRYETIDGRFIEMYATPVYRESVRIGIVLVHRDITREYEVDQMKSDLVSTVSHELRTPLSSVLGFTELLLTREVEGEKKARYLKTIHKEAKRLTNLVNDFLDIQRMESGKQSYEQKQYSLVGLASEAIETFQFEEKHEIQIIDDTKHDQVYIDRDRIQQVFSNLLGNAVKFSPYGGKITVHLTNSKDRIKVAIHDEGLGIPEADLTNLFKKFHRTKHGMNNGDLAIGGTGLGLSITKEIIQSHEGEIWVESEVDVGTTVYFTLPLIEFYSSENKDVENGKSVVLVVEDDPSMAYLLTDELQTRGFTTIHRVDAETGFDTAMTASVTCIIVDLRLNDEVDGWDLIKRLRETEKTKDLLIIIFSALDPDREKLDAYGIEHYLTKPYEIGALTKLIDYVKGKDDPSN